MPNIHFLPDDKSFECPENVTILKNARENNIISKLVVSAKGHKIITDLMFKNVKKMVCKD